MYVVVQIQSNFCSHKIFKFALFIWLRWSICVDTDDRHRINSFGHRSWLNKIERKLTCAILKTLKLSKVEMKISTNKFKVKLNLTHSWTIESAHWTVHSIGSRQSWIFDHFWVNVMQFVFVWNQFVHLNNLFIIQYYATGYTSYLKKIILHCYFNKLVIKLSITANLITANQILLTSHVVTINTWPLRFNTKVAIATLI